MSEQDHILIESKDLKKYYPVRRGLFSSIHGYLKAVDGVSLAIRKKETLGLVGESGSGKTTTGRLLLRLIEPTAGKVSFEGRDMFSLSRKELRLLRQKIQIIFQDPYGSLDPRMKAFDIVGEGLKIHHLAKGNDLKERVTEMMEKVGLSREDLDKYPHEFSGGQRQRLGIARALVLNPSFIVCDEPVSSLDVSIQAQIINLLKELQEEMSLSYLFISHDLNLVGHISERVAVMYLGKIIEIGNKEAVFSTCLHPYTKALLSAIPKADPWEEKKRIILPGEIPSPFEPPPGCPFHPRCFRRIEPCDHIVPPLESKGDPHHLTACHNPCR